HTIAISSLKQTMDQMILQITKLGQQFNSKYFNYLNYSLFSVLATACMNMQTSNPENFKSLHNMFSMDQSNNQSLSNVTQQQQQKQSNTTMKRTDSFDDQLVAKVINKKKQQNIAKK